MVDVSCLLLLVPCCCVIVLFVRCWVCLLLEFDDGENHGERWKFAPRKKNIPDLTHHRSRDNKSKFKFHSTTSSIMMLIDSRGTHHHHSHTNAQQQRMSSNKTRFITSFALLLVLFIFFACQSVSVLALYEDEAGKQDWYRENIGRVNQVLFPSSSSSSSSSSSHQQKSKLIIVRTRENVLAGVNLRTGSVGMLRLCVVRTCWVQVCIFFSTNIHWTFVCSLLFVVCDAIYTHTQTFITIFFPIHVSLMLWSLISRFDCNRRVWLFIITRPAWRRLFDKSDVMNQLKSISDHQFLTFSSNCSRVKSWDDNGLQMWQFPPSPSASTSSSSSCTSDALPVMINQQLHIVISSSSSHIVYCVNAANGSLLWKYELSSSSSVVAGIRLMQSSKQLSIIGLVQSPSSSPSSNNPTTTTTTTISRVTQTVLNVADGNLVRSVQSGETQFSDSPVVISQQLVDSVRVVGNSIHMLTSEGNIVSAVFDDEQSVRVSVHQNVCQLCIDAYILHFRVDGLCVIFSGMRLLALIFQTLFLLTRPFNCHLATIICDDQGGDWWASGIR